LSIQSAAKLINGNSPIDILHQILGGAQVVDALKAIWSGGQTGVWQQVAADQILTLNLPALLFSNGFD